MQTIPHIADNAERLRGRGLIDFSSFATGEMRPMRLTAAMVENIRLRVTLEEKHRFAEIARERGVTLSDLVRFSLTEAAKRVAA